MKAKTLQIIWHSKEPVFSVDFHPEGYIATGGQDKDIKLWEVVADADGTPSVRYLSSLSGHSKTINCVRFSHSGHCLASAGDSGELLIWRPALAPTAATAAQTPGPAGSPAAAAATTPGTPLTAALSPSRPAAAAAAAAEAATPVRAGKQAVEVPVWKLSATLRGHHDDVTDVAWAHDDCVVLSGSVENQVMMFDVDTRRPVARLEGHCHYVQGVAWDPLGAWMVSASADRSVRVHGLKPPPTGSKAATAAARDSNGRSSTALARDVLHTHTLSKVSLQPPVTPPQAGSGGATPAAAAGAAGPQAGTAAAGADATGLQLQQQAPSRPLKPLQAPLFADESLNSFFRRLAWSPEGSLLAVPAGVYRQHAGQQPRHATYLYARGHWGCPLLALPCPSKPSTVVRFCPRIFALRQQQHGRGSNGGSDGNGGGSNGSGSSEEQAAASVLGLPYRLVLAVATLDSVLIYDTQTCEPLMMVGPLHFAPITDLAWSHCGSVLAISSHDGYCSMVTFAPGELGQPLQHSELPQGLQAALSKVRAAQHGTAQAAAAKAGGAGVGAAAAAATPRPASACKAGGAGAAVAAAAGAAAGTPGELPQTAVKQQQQQKGQSAPTDLGVVGNAGKSSPAVGAATTAAAAAPAARFGSSAAVAVQQQKPPRRVVPVPVSSGHAAPAAPAAFGPSPAAPTAAPPSAAAAAAAPTTTAAGAGDKQRPPRRVVPQPVTAAGFGVSTAAAAGFGGPAAAAGTGADATAGTAQQQQQQQQQKSSTVGAAAAGGAAAGGSAAGKSRVGLAAVQAALAAAAKKKRAAAEQATAQQAGGGSSTAVRDAGGDADASKRPKLA